MSERAPVERQRPPCWNKALDLLARRPHFAAELRAKLLQRGYPEDEVEATLGRLGESGFVDDRQTAVDWVAARRDRDGWGRRRLALELRKRGVSDDVVDLALDGLDDDEEETLAVAAGERWLARARRGDRAALARHLERRGYPSRVIVAVLDRLGGRLAADAGTADAETEL